MKKEFKEELSLKRNEKTINQEEILDNNTTMRKIGDNARKALKILKKEEER